MATKSILVNYVGYPASARSLVLDNGLANLAACLLEKGHETKILDYATVTTIKRLFPHAYKDELETLTGRIMNAFKKESSPDPKDLDAFYKIDGKIDQWQKEKVQDIAKEIKEYVIVHGIDFVGMKLWLGDGLEGSIAIAEVLKKEIPGLPIFAGGPHVDSFREKIFDLTNAFDVLVYGEGEETITMLADYVEGKKKLEDISNLIYKKNGHVIANPVKRVDDLDNLPFPIYDDDVYLAAKGNQKIKIIFIDESRGCPNACSYCIHPSKSGNSYRTRDAKKVVDEMQEISSKYKVNAFKFAGSNPPPYLKRQIAKEILRRKLNTTYTCFGHVGGAPKEDFALLKKSGCISIFFGIESGSQEILDKSMNKGVKIEEIRKAIKACKKTGLSVIGSVIVPAPWETEEHRQETLNLLLDIKLDSVMVCFPKIVLGIDWVKHNEKYCFDIPKESKEFWKIVMTYKVKWFYPPTLWKSIPHYILNKKPFAELAKETLAFEYTLRKKGYLTDVTDDEWLIAKYSGKSPGEFKAVSNRYLSTGNFNEVGRLVKTINESITNSRQVKSANNL